MGHIFKKSYLKNILYDTKSHTTLLCQHLQCWGLGKRRGLEWAMAFQEPKGKRGASGKNSKRSFLNSEIHGFLLEPKTPPAWEAPGPRARSKGRAIVCHLLVDAELFPHHCWQGSAQAHSIVVLPRWWKLHISGEMMFVSPTSSFSPSHLVSGATRDLLRLGVFLRFHPLCHYLTF